MIRPIRWDDFEPGAALGEVTQTCDLSLAAAWQGIFGGHDAGDSVDSGPGPEPGPIAPAEGAGIAIAMMMRGYLAVVTPRPPGNIHARQLFTLEAPPRPGEAIRTTVRCVSKAMKRERRYVDLAVVGTGEGARPIYTGLLTLIWAA